MVTFRLTVEQFRLLLQVVLAADAPDDLANLVLMTCKRPKDGVIAVPLPAEDAGELTRLVGESAHLDSRNQELARVIARQRDEGS